MKKKIKKLIHKYISIPKYEKELLKKDKQIADLKGAYDYVYKLMHYIVTDLGLSTVILYMDDYVIISRDKEYLEYALKIIRDKLENEYKLKINDKKTFIVDIESGFEFLGYRYRVINNKIYISIKSENKRRRNNNIKKNDYLYSNGFIDYKKYFHSMNNYMNSYKYIRR